MRLVASSFRAMEAIWKTFPAVCKHFNTAAVDSLRSQSYVGLSKLINDFGITDDSLQEFRAVFGITKTVTAQC